MIMPPNEHHNVLPAGYRLHWYHIEKVLGRGGFGITYLAKDTNLDHWVAIKEYLPVEFAVRQEATSVRPLSAGHGEQFNWGLERFISEAQTLARFKHPHIVRVHAVFCENNTAYMVMEYERGHGLDSLLKGKKTLEEERLKAILFPILEGLEMVHAANFIHRDIKPPNIYIREDSSPVLLDFGSARQSFSEQTRTLTTMVSPGYAPFEQYAGKSMKQGPWTDIYGLGATLYRAVTGIGPPDAMDRSESILHTGKDIFVTASEISAGRYSPDFLRAIDHALAFKPGDRPQSIDAWRTELDGAGGDVSGRGAVVNENTTITVTESVAATAVGSTPGVMENQPSETIPPAITSVVMRAVSRCYDAVKKILKWLLVLLVLLILLLVFTQHRKKTTEPVPMVEPATESAPVPVPEELPAVAEPPAAVDETAERIEQFLLSAREDLDALRLTSPAGNNAVEKYREVLALQPGHPSALEGLDNVVLKYIDLMDNSLAGGNITRAANYLAKAESVNPDHPALPAARTRLEQARQSARIPETAVEESVPEKQAGVPEQEKQALHTLKERLRTNPRDRQARRELQALAEKFQENIKQAMDEGNYALAREYVYAVQSVSGDNPRAVKRLNEVLRRIEQKEREAAR